MVLSLKRKRIRILLILLSVVLLFLFFPSWTPAITDENGAVPPNSIASLENIKLGGIEQSILIRGKDKCNPVLLFLHGGPGYPQIAYARKHQSLLEEDFVVVNWDQRGAGKSYHWGMTDQDMQLDKLISDTAELTVFLKNRFQQQKIFLVGHSWGSLLATLTVQKHPEHYYSYIGVGQVANSPLGEEVSYQYVLEEAKRRQNEQAIRDLESIGPPPYKHPRKDATLERKWVMAFGGSERKTNSYNDLINGVLFAPEYTWLDGVRLALGDSFSRTTLLPQTRQINLSQTVPQLQVPAYYGMGRHDYMTPSSVAYEYYEKLLAPDKQFIWFEESAHFPHFEEPEKFHQMMVQIRDKTMTRSHRLCS
ncbi:alpha/beta hydrolase [Brevibacillus antibioticus]|uniref:prolyl aminopeptidase n=1 Tax=Brevibacillus antibioticus TaxID=2570228 RepID=A0A4U2Y155_9BACL|nr:alpha/beta hydrolase [Brevibacillus antibioticus]TKI54098.1 alpha/beta hydrolase [Brevibacillus antibioticus]